jgi:hypothetical protein
MNNYLDVVNEQLSVLEKGLLNLTEKLIIFITKYNKDDVNLNNLLNKFNKNKNFIIVTSPENLYEKFAINNYKNYIAHNQYHVYYFHTKGLSHAYDDDLSHIFNSRRQILNYYTLERYRINLKLLETYDAVGCSLSLYPKKHFSGNFWWSKSSHVNTLQNINDNYLSPEMYILDRSNVNCISLANDTNDILIENYNFKEDINFTKNIIVIEEHKKRINLR